MGRPVQLGELGRYLGRDIEHTRTHQPDRSYLKPDSPYLGRSSRFGMRSELLDSPDSKIVVFTPEAFLESLGPNYGIGRNYAVDRKESPKAGVIVFDPETRGYTTKKSLTLAPYNAETSGFSLN